MSATPIHSRRRTSNPNSRSATTVSSTRPPAITACTSVIGASASAATWRTHAAVATTIPRVHQRLENSATVLLTGARSVDRRRRDRPPVLEEEAEDRHERGGEREQEAELDGERHSSAAHAASRAQAGLGERVGVEPSPALGPEHVGDGEDAAARMPRCPATVRTGAASISTASAPARATRGAALVALVEQVRRGDAPVCSPCAASRSVSSGVAAHAFARAQGPAGAVGGQRRAHGDEVAGARPPSRAPHVRRAPRPRRPRSRSSSSTIAALGPPIPVVWIVSGRRRRPSPCSPTARGCG